LRQNLASLSWFHARWKEPIAKLANQESGTRGHYYETRFGSRELVDMPATLCANVYVDLNQLKAGMSDSLLGSHCSGIQDRLRAWLQMETQSIHLVEGRGPGSGIDGFGPAAGGGRPTT
jgi:hypothetical protein